MASTPEEGMATLIRNLESATGQTIEQWIGLARETGIDKHKPLVDHLKERYELKHGYANQIALRALTAVDAPAAGREDLVAAQYAGPKAALKPIYDALVEAISAFGADITFAPKKAYVSVRRSKQFAILQPGAGRVDVGVVLKDVPAAGRLEAAGSFNAMVTHRVRITTLAEIDPQFTAWLHAAYSAA